MYDYANWISYRDTEVYRSIAFADFNHLNGMGYGLQATESIDKGISYCLFL